MSSLHGQPLAAAPGLEDCAAAACLWISQHGTADSRSENWVLQATCHPFNSFSL